MTVAGEPTVLPMSKTASTKSVDVDLRPARSGEHALEWFEDEIWHDHRVCSNCFAALKATCWLEWTDNGKQKSTEDAWRTPDAELGEDLEDPPESVVSVQPKATSRTTCRQCGSVGGLSQRDPLDRQTARQCGLRLARRLGDRGYDVDEYELVAVVGQLKSDPERQADDKKIFATAAALGVKHG